VGFLVSGYFQGPAKIKIADLSILLRLIARFMLPDSSTFQAELVAVSVNLYIARLTPFIS
jgi:hypothetical protein